MSGAQQHYEMNDLRRASTDSADPVPALLNNHYGIVTIAPETRFKLGYGSVTGIVVNRMIGMDIISFHCSLLT
jgi:hypothetical protein